MTLSQQLEGNKKWPSPPFRTQMRYSGLLRAGSNALDTKVNPNTSAVSTHCHGKAIARERLNSNEYSHVLTFYDIHTFFFLKLFPLNLRHDTFVLLILSHFTPASINDPNAVHPVEDVGFSKTMVLACQCRVTWTRTTLRHILSSALGVHQKHIQNREKWITGDHTSQPFYLKPLSPDTCTCPEKNLETENELLDAQTCLSLSLVSLFFLG